MRFRWLFGGRGVVVSVTQTQHPEDAPRPPRATPSFAKQRALQEDCRRPITVSNLCTQTHTHTNDVITHTFPWKSSGDFGEILYKDFFSLHDLEHHSLKHGVVAAIAVKKKPHMQSEIRYSSSLYPLMHYLHQGRQASIRQTVCWVIQQASPLKKINNKMFE